MHPYAFLLTWLMYSSALCGEDSTKISLEHSDGVFDDNPGSLRVRIQVEQPILAQDVMRMVLEDTKSTSECTDFNRYCNFTGEDTDPLRLQCSCHENCDLFGNCCWDAPLTKHRKNAVQCYALSELGVARIGAYMVGRCPEMSGSDLIRSRCESNNTSPDPFATLPVSSLEITFKNIYCALCNDQTNVVPWSFNISSCLWSSFKNCSVSLKVPALDSIVRCDREAISTCPVTTGPDSENCDLYYAPVRDMNVPKKTYKNKFCAFCRDVVDLECVQPPYITSEPFSGPGPRFTSYSIIFDIDFWHGGSYVGGVEKCQPEVPICKEVTCVQNICSLDVINTKTIVESSCTKWTLDGVEYILDKDGELNLLNETLQVNTTCVVENLFGRNQEVLTTVCLCISLACLTLKIILYIFVETNRNISQKSILMLCCSILAAQFLFLMGSKENEWGFVCVIIGLLMHYFFLVSFFWTNILAFDIWRTFSTMANTVATSPTKRFFRYNLYCWLGPCLILTSALIFQWGVAFEPLYPGYGSRYCWISKKLPLMIFFACPLGLLLCVNMFLFVWTAFRIWSAVRAARVARDMIGADKVRFVLYFKLAFIMGMTWIFGFASAFVRNDVTWCLFIAFNGLQGAFLLLAFTRLGLKMYLVRLRMYVRKATQATSSRSTKSSQECSTSKM